jgi:beta-lactamase regulating signal transducer with metallopeptidase domain
VIAALLDHLWQSTLFCGVIWVLARLCRSNGAALRHGLWLTASIKFLVPFAALYIVGAWVGLPAPVGSEPLFFDPAVQAAGPMVSPVSVHIAARDSAWGFTAVLLLVWFVGALVVGARWLFAWRAAALLARAARPAPGAPPDARVTDADVEPAVAGSFHPVVLLPAALLGRLTDTQMNAVLAHEREHIRRRDNLKANIHRLAETLFWFHPAVWWIGRRMVEERERACDEAVLENGHEGPVYAAGILEVCRHCVDRPRRVFSVSALSGNLSERIRHILAGARPAAVGLAKAQALLLGALACAGIPLITGAADGTLRRQALLNINSRTLAAAQFQVETATGADAPPIVIVNAHEILIRNRSPREIVALAYGLQTSQVQGESSWMDSPRYDIRLTTAQPVSDPEALDPAALRSAVTKLLAKRFGLEIYVNQLCQSPCGPLALTRAANSAE